MAEELTYNYSGVIKMSVNTNILAFRFVIADWPYVYRVDY